MFRSSVTARRRMRTMRLFAAMGLAIAFATFVSVANAADDAASQPAVAVVVEDVVVPAPAEPVVDETAPATPEAAPAVEPIVPAPVPAPAPAPAAPVPAAAASDPVAVSAPVPPRIHLATPAVTRMAPAVQANPGNVSCPSHASVCRVTFVAGVWTIGADSVRVCHATSGVGSSGAGFNLITPNSDSIAIPGSVGNNHGGHDTPNFGPFAPGQASIAMGDIVEPFNYWSDTNNDGIIDASEVLSYAGNNLGVTAQPSGIAWSTIYGAAAGVTGASILGGDCAAPAVAPPPICPAGTTGVFPACVPIVVIVTCPAGSMSPTVSTDVNGDGVIDAKDCVVAPPIACPAGTTGVFPVCIPNPIVLTCPAGTTGVFPNCIPNPVLTCPAGTSGTYPICVPNPVIATCPAGSTTTTVSTDVNGDGKIDANDCVATTPATCPVGTTGTPPNCITSAAATPTTPTTDTIDPVVTAAVTEPVSAPVAVADVEDPATAEVAGGGDEPVEETTSAATTADVSADSGELPFTGLGVDLLVVLGMIAMMAGGSLYRWNRRRAAARS